MGGFQPQVEIALRPVPQEEIDAHASNEPVNLENAFIYIDGKRYGLPDLMQAVVEKLNSGRP